MVRRIDLIMIDYDLHAPHEVARSAWLQAVISAVGRMRRSVAGVRGMKPAAGGWPHEAATPARDAGLFRPHAA